MKTLLAGLFVFGALATASSAPSASGHAPVGFLPHSGSAPSLGTPRPVTQLDCGTITCAAYEAGVNGFVQDVAADSGTANNVYSVATQYSDTTGNVAYDETFGGTYVDTSGAPLDGGCSSTAGRLCITDADLQQEIATDMAKAGWTGGPNHLFVILLPNGVDTCLGKNATKTACASTYFCAYHTEGGSYGNHFFYAVEPFAAEWSCSGSGQSYPNGPEIDETVNTLSHEENESITDPSLVTQSGNLYWGWTTGIHVGGAEMADLCSWTFGNPLGTTPAGQPYNQVIDGHDYSLQLEYSNADNGCVEHLGGPAVSAAGPLVYHGGPVMRTLTVYTIFWIPTLYDPTVNTAAPVVTGPAGVGQHLHTTTGEWTNSPGTFRTRWLRCDAAGANCVTLDLASQSYKIVKADVGHTLRSEVMAGNGDGWAPAGYTESLPTAVVVAKPGNLTKPTIFGPAQVGAQMSASSGTWTNSPTYAYQWLRCSPSGGSCTAIPGATSSSYTPTTRDVSHTLKVQVTATNAAGSRVAQSAKSPVVSR